MSSLRIGIIGCGAVTEQIHLPPLLARDDCRITAIVDRDPRRLAAVNRLVPAAKAGASYAEVMDHFDAAIVALPHNLHAPVSIDLLRAGKKVLVEKPMAITSAECDAMIAAAKGPASLTIGQMRRFLPAVAFADDLLRRGLLGAIKHVDVREGGAFGWPVESDFQFRKDKSGGGVLVDTGAHALDMVIGWFGAPTPVAYMDDARGGVETDCIADMTLPNGATCHAELSRTHGLRNTAVIVGEKASIEVAFYSNAVTLTLADGTAGTSFSCAPTPAHPDMWRQMFDLQLADWVRAITDNAPPRVSGVEGRKVVALIESLYALQQPLEFSWEAT